LTVIIRHGDYRQYQVDQVEGAEKYNDDEEQGVVVTIRFENLQHTLYFSNIIKVIHLLQTITE